MRRTMAMGILMMLAGLLVLPAGPASADEKVSTRPVIIDKAPGATGDPEKDKKCDGISESDERNLCRALHRDTFNSDKEKQNRYANKDHSYYYCTLIQNRDKQAYCYAVVQNQKSMCGNIIDGELEKKCNSEVK